MMRERQTGWLERFVIRRLNKTHTLFAYLTAFCGNIVNQWGFDSAVALPLH